MVRFEADERAAEVSEERVFRGAIGAHLQEIWVVLDRVEEQGLGTRD